MEMWVKVPHLLPILMSVYFTSDPHLGHKNISKFCPWVESTKQRNDMFFEQWQKTIKKRDIVYMLGDVAFDIESLQDLSKLPGRKILIKGNHDDYLHTLCQAQVFEQIHGIISYKGFWLSHAPIHPQEMRKRTANIHGHTHDKIVMNAHLGIPNPMYVNVCIDHLYPTTGKMFMSLDEVRAKFNQ